VFRFFERLVDPYAPHAETDAPPTRLWPFLKDLTEPFRPVFNATLVFAVLVGIAALMTVGVYGLVAGIVKLDDLGLYLSRREGALAALGRGLVAGAPYLMKLLSVVGTAAMFLVGGGILSHGVPLLHHLVEGVAAAEVTVPGLAAIVHGLGPLLLNLVIGLAVGALVLGAVTLIQKLRRG